MNPPSSQLRQQSATEQVHATQGETVREFATPEELLRHDRAGTPVPDAVAAALDAGRKYINSLDLGSGA